MLSKMFRAQLVKQCGCGVEGFGGVLLLRFEGAWHILCNPSFLDL